MTHSQSLIRSTLLIYSLLLGASLAAFSQQQSSLDSDETARGVSLYEQGDTDGAIKTLREVVSYREGDSKAWHYLGLALIRQGNLKDARDALSHAAHLRARAFDRYLSFASDEVRDEQLARLKGLLRDALDSQTRYLEILSDTTSIGFGSAILEGLQARSDCMDQHTKLVDGRPVLLKSDFKIQRPRILAKPEPMYSAEARNYGTNGTVRLRVVFSADGKVKFIDAVQPLGHGLTEEAIKAAMKIKFEPEMVCAKPVSAPMMLEYSFHIMSRRWP
jgi:TonB family protein